MSDSNKSWLSQHSFHISQAIRILFAFWLMIIAVMPLVNFGITHLAKEIAPSSNILTESKTLVYTVPEITTINKKTDSYIKNKHIAKTKNEGMVATQQTWIYALQLVTWLGVVGMCLWAVVRLIRDE